MKSYCLKCKKDTENINPRVSNSSHGKTMLLSNVEDQEAKGLLSNLGLRTPLSQIPIMNEIVNKLLLAG